MLNVTIYNKSQMICEQTDKLTTNVLYHKISIHLLIILQSGDVFFFNFTTFGVVLNKNTPLLVGPAMVKFGNPWPMVYILVKNRQNPRSQL